MVGPESTARLRQRAIGKRLREGFAAFASEPVPQEFIDLLMKLDQADAARACPQEGHA
jgi:hypothetical protein